MSTVSPLSGASATSEPNDPPRGPNPSNSPTRIIRRAPTRPVPVGPARPTGPAVPPDPAGDPDATGITGSPPAAAGVPIAASTVAILSGWATSVVATDLIAGWWHSDRLFCVAVGFLTLMFGVTTVSGVILLLRRRPLGRYLITVGAVIALLTFGSLFIAGARVPWIVHAIPVLQIASAVLAMHPATKRWLPAQ